MKNSFALFFGVFLCIQRQTTPKRKVFVWMCFVVWIYYVFLNRRETVELN